MLTDSFSSIPASIAPVVMTGPNPRARIRFEVSNIGERYWGLNLTIYFFAEAIREPWIRSVAHQEIIEKLVKENIAFHRDSPK